MNILIPSELADERVGGWGATGVCDSSTESLPLIVDVEEERVKVCVKGARWVSFNSVIAYALATVHLKC